MNNEERFARVSEGLYYIIAGLCAAATTWVVVEELGIDLRGKVQQAAKDWQWRLRQEQFDFFYSCVWPSIRAARRAKGEGEHAGQSD